MVNIAVNLCDLLQQWNAQINIPAVPKTHISGKDITRYYIQRSPVVQVLQELKETRKPLEVPMTILLKRLTEKPAFFS